MTDDLSLLPALPNSRLRLYAVRHAHRVPLEEVLAAPCDGAELVLSGVRMRVAVETRATAARGVQLNCAFTVLEGSVDFASVGLAIECDAWSRDEWVFLPACAYAGNRFPSAPPRNARRDDPRPDPDNWVTITRAPHLEHGPGASRIQVLVGDCSTPCVGVFSPATGRGLLLVTDQGTAHGDAGLHVEENADRTRARILVKSPGVREGGKYNWQGALPDVGATLRTGDRLSVRVVVHAFPAASPEVLYARFVHARKELARPRERHDLPFDSAFRLIEEKHNRESWVEEFGYWSVGMREVPSQDWQTGWVGGPNTAWPLLIRGSAASWPRALRVWDFIATRAVTPAGFVRGCFGGGAWQGNPERCYLRYSADTLYFLMKTLLYLRVGPPHVEPQEAWLKLARGLCDGFARCWERAGHLPHYADGQTGDVLLGGSCAAALAPAGLALAARYFGESRYRDIAEEAARRFRDRFLAQGLTNGGPGDIHQNVDSESAFALLESFVVLMEERDGAAEWIDAARRGAAYCATWVTSYDFRFPAASTFGQLDMLTTGTVWANVQNKHAAPGICTLSGAALVKLWRATGEDVWLELIRDIARCLPQYVSRADRPIPDARTSKRWKVMRPGWVNERVNLSDWEVRGRPGEEIGVGEIFGGSTWSEPAVLNTIAEVPGLYLDTDTLALTVFDHVHAHVFHADDHAITLRVTNATPFAAAPVLLAEGAGERRDRWLGTDPLAGLPTIAVPPFATVDYRLLRVVPIRTMRL